MLPNIPAVGHTRSHVALPEAEYSTTHITVMKGREPTQNQVAEIAQKCNNKHTYPMNMWSEI